MGYFSTAHLKRSILQKIGLNIYNVYTCINISYDDFNDKQMGK